jgi:Na+/pantothenate symporter
MDANHFLISAAVLLAGIWFYLKYQFPITKSFRLNLFSIFILITLVSGIFMLIKFDFISILNRLAYTVYDLSLIGILVLCIFYLEKSFKNAEAK